MSPGQVLLAAFAAACGSSIALGIATLKGDRRPNPVLCSWEVTRVLGCTAGAAKAGVPPNRTTETQSNLVIVINACSCSFVAATDLIDGRALSATTFAFRY
jgi:hypothetical protein